MASSSLSSKRSLVLDTGTSVALTVAPGKDYTAETVFAPVVGTVRKSGLPDLVGFDRDPRSRWGGERTRFSEPVRALLAVFGGPGV